MDRNREARRATMAATNGLSRRRHRASSLRDSPEEDGVLELQETGRLRDRKKDRDRERDRDRDRFSRSKRRRGDRLIHGNSNREDGGDDSSEESVNDEEDEDDGGVGDRVGGGSGSMRMLPPSPSTTTMCSSTSLLNQRKSFPLATKSLRPARTWKAADEMIGVSVPRKARSASTKRSHEWASCPGIIGDSIYRQTSTSPVRPSPTTVVASSPTPVSPSGSNISMKKKLKHSGPKFRPPKTTSSKSSSSAQDEIEIEIAEVLYGMMRQPQGPTNQEAMATDSIKFETREVNKSTTDAKSIISSPISSSQSTIPLSSITLPQNSSSSVAPMSVVAPKRKKPRPVKYDDESPLILTHQNIPISAASKVGADQSAKTETCSPILDKDPGSAAENGRVSYGLGQSQAVSLPVSQPEPIVSSVVSEPQSVTHKTENGNLVTSMEEPQSLKELVLTRLDHSREDVIASKENSRSSEFENQREEKFQIDLMAPPQQRKSPERNSKTDNVAVDSKLMVTDTETDKKPMINVEAKIRKNIKQEAAEVEPEKTNAMVEENESKKSCIGKERNIDLQFDLEKPDNRESGNASVSGNNSNKLNQLEPQSHQQSTNTEKTAQSNTLPLPLSMGGWPGGLPPLGYMAPLQGPVSMDGSIVSSAAIQPPPYLFSQPRAKRCATHCYIARNICYHQQILKMNSFWPAASAGSASLYGATHLPLTELHANILGRGVNSGPDKGKGPIFSGLLGMDKGAQAANIGDAVQRKQLLLQQSPPPGAPSNILHGPAFIFPLGQQQNAAAAACVRPGSGNSPTPGCASLSTSPITTSATVPVTAAAAAPAMSFNYPNMPGNEPQYLVLQNNAYPFPIPAHVGAPPAYRGPHAQAMPFFNGSFYSSQMLHPSQIQQQQQPSRSKQNQHGHQNSSISSGSTSSQNHLQNHQHRPHAGGINGSTGSLQAFPAPKNQSMQPIQLQSRQQQQRNHHVPHQARQLESETGTADSPSTADSRDSRRGMSIYGHNFAMPMHAQNFALMTPASFNGTSGTSVSSGNDSEKKQLQQHDGSKGVVEASQAFAMSFASINGSTTTPGFDIASVAQHPVVLHSVPDIRQGYPFMAAAAQAAHQKKTYSVPEEGKNGGDSSNGGEERRIMAGKDSTVGQPIALARSDLSDAAGSTISGNTLIDSSARSLNLGSASARASGSFMPATIGAANASSAQQKLQRNQQHQQRNQQQLQVHQQQQQQQMHQNQQQQQMQRYQQQQMIIDVQKHQQQLAAAARPKTPTTLNGSVYSDHLPLTSVAAKFPNAVSSFSQNLVQSSSVPVQSPQWKNSPRTNHSSQTPPSMSSSASSAIKNLPQQGRSQQAHTQISFATNPKLSKQGQGVQPDRRNQSPSPPVMVGSPTTSSVSKGTGGSPRTTTTTTSTGNKTNQASTLSSQQGKNSSASSLKSSPVGGRNVPSILGNPHITTSLSTVGKSQQQQEISKQSIQQPHLYFSGAYMQAPVPHSNSTISSAAAASTYYHQRRRPELQKQPQSSSSGILSPCSSVSLVNTSSTSDPSKVAAAAMKGGGMHSKTVIHPPQFAAAQSGSAHQLMSYVHAVPTAVQVKPAEQKQPAGE